MNRILATVLLVLCTVTLLPAVVSGGAGQPRLPDDDENRLGQYKAEPAWVADPTEGGKRKAAVASWIAHASKDEQKKARQDACDSIIATFKLPATVKIKELNMYVDPKGKTYIQLTAR